MSEVIEEYLDVETITIPMDTGKNQVFAIMDYITVDNVKYAIISPVEGDEITEDVTIVGYKEDGKNVVIDWIEDDKLFNKIAEAYNNQL